jgi:hypothetical protein
MPLRLALILSALLLSACASLDYTDYKQTVMVLSDPPGVKVYEGENYLGTTPAYVRVNRGRRPHIRFVPEDGVERKIKLKTEYRWDDSFAMNLLLLTLAPAGWVADWATGTAWELRDPPLQTFGKGGAWPAARVPGIVAIAPPPAKDIDIADGLGTALDAKLRTTSQFQVLDYGMTAPYFQYHRASGGPPQDKQARYRLMSDLKADHILHSQVERKADDTFVVRALLKDAITTRTAREYSFEVSPEEAHLKDEFQRRRLFSSFFNLLPNTMWINFSGYTPNLRVNDTEYEGKETPADDAGEQFLKYVSAISISTMKRPIANVRGQWVFEFVPALILSKKEFQLPKYLPGVTFERLYTSAGYGIEGGYLWRHGYAYADFIPMLTWSQMSYQTQAGRAGTQSHTSVQSMIEVGYSKFLTDHLVSKFFLRNVFEDTVLWSDVMTEINGTPTWTEAAGSVFVGFAFGYYIPSTLKSKEGWRVREKY